MAGDIGQTLDVANSAAPIAIPARAQLVLPLDGHPFAKACSFPTLFATISSICGALAVDRARHAYRCLAGRLRDWRREMSFFLMLRCSLVSPPAARLDGALRLAMILATGHVRASFHVRYRHAFCRDSGRRTMATGVLSASLGSNPSKLFLFVALTTTIDAFFLLRPVRQN